MKFIIFISDTIRQGNFPRLDGFTYSSEHDKYLYSGRELTVGEFNEAAKVVYNPAFRTQGFTLLPQAVGPEIDAQIAKDEAEAAEALAAANKAAEEAQFAIWAENERLAAESAPVVEASAEEAVDPVAETETAEDSPQFRFDGRQIYLGDERIAGLFGDEDQLRVRAEHSELRPAIEAWIQSQPTQ